MSPAIRRYKVRPFRIKTQDFAGLCGGGLVCWLIFTRWLITPQPLELVQFGFREGIGLDVSYTPIKGTSLRGQYSWSYRAGDLKYSMADSSTAVRGIPIRFAGGYWARRQLHAGIRYASTRSILMELLCAVNGGPGGVPREGMVGISEACI